MWIVLACIILFQSYIIRNVYMCNNCEKYQTTMHIYLKHAMNV